MRQATLILSAKPFIVQWKCNQQFSVRSECRSVDAQPSNRAKGINFECENENFGICKPSNLHLAHIVRLIGADSSKWAKVLINSSDFPQFYHLFDGLRWHVRRIRSPFALRSLEKGKFIVFRNPFPLSPFSVMSFCDSVYSQQVSLKRFLSSSYSLVIIWFHFIWIRVCTLRWGRVWQWTVRARK